MPDVNEELRCVAKDGSVPELKRILREPGCNPLSTNEIGTTALMWAAAYGQESSVQILLPVSDALARCKYGMTALIQAARYGHEGCVRLLLPVSDASANDNGGLTASDWARRRSFERSAQFIDAYVLAQSECCAIKEAVGTKATSGRMGPRV